MTQLLVLAENESLLQTWEQILSLSTNFSYTTMLLKDFTEESVSLDQLNVVFFTTEGLTEEIKQYFKIFKDHSIPIICTDKEVSPPLSYEDIVEMGIRGTISDHFSILTLLELIPVVMKGKEHP